MASEHPSSMDEESVGGSLPNIMSQRKLPKKMHKAEREKLKRDHLNELFLELGHAIEPSRQSNCKASILGDATLLLRDLVTKVESLRKENAALVTESHYVSVEKNELKDENTALEAEIGKLQNKLRERMQSDPLWSNSTTATSLALPQPASTAFPMQQQQQPPVGCPAFAIPLHQEFQFYEEGGNTSAPPSHLSRVARPQARYPTPDSWPLQLLWSLPRAAHEANQSSSSSRSTITNSG